MSRGNKNVDLDALLRRAHPSDVGTTGESRLDTLMRQHFRRQAGTSTDNEPARKETPLDRIRSLFEIDLIPAFDALQRKYAADGVRLSLDAGAFLRGGRDITVVIEFAGFGMRFEGTVMPAAIAFRLTRYASDDPAGLTASGPTLSTRNLDGRVFRDFICDRIASLVQSVVQRKN